MTVDENVRRVFVAGGRTLVRHSQNGDRIYVCGNNHVLKVFNSRDTEQEPETLDIIDKITSFELSPDSRLGVVTSSTGECYSYDLEKLSSKAQLITKSPLALRDSTFTHSGSSILCGGADGDLRLVDLQNLDGPPKIHNTADQVTSISYNHTGDLAAISLSNGNVVVLSYTSSNPSKVHLLENVVMEKKGLDDDDEEDDEGFGGNESDDEQGDNTSYNDQIMKLSTTKCEWHTNGDLLAVPTKTREIQVYDRSDLSAVKYAFKGASSHDKPIISLKWSPNGNYLASIGLDNKLIIWSTKSKKQIKTLALPMTCCSLSWGKNDKDKEYEIVVGTNNGCIVRFTSIVPQSENSGRDDLFGDLDDPSNNGSQLENGGRGVNGFLDTHADEAGDDDDDDDGGNDDEDRAEVDDLDDMKDDDDNEVEDESMLYGHEDDFIVDDDGSGYAEKRSFNEVERGSYSSSVLKRGKHSRPRSGPQGASSIFEAQKALALRPYSQGGTPWNNSRRYISINPSGYVWSVKQEGFNTVTVSFFDRALNKEYHFRDGNNFDIASMNDEGIVFASSGKENKGKLIIAYRSHSNPNKSWEKRIHQMSSQEYITAVSLSNTNVFVCTSLGYVRKLSLFGKVERIEKNAPVVACINNERYLFTVTTSAIGSLSFNLQDLDGKYLQRNEPLPLETSNPKKHYHAIKGLFFSLDGDPCIVGNDDILLVLSRWRTPLQAVWIPLLDTREGVKVIAAGENVKCWPLGLLKDQFNFIAVRGGEFPSFPLSLPAEISIRIPLNYRDDDKKKKNGNNKEKRAERSGDGFDGEHDRDNDDDDDDDMEASEVEEDPEEELVRCITLGELLNDAISNDDVLDTTAEERLNEFSIIYDRTLLKQFGQVCADSQIAESLDIVSKLRDDRALQAARLIAERAGNGPLSRKITELQDLRLQFAEEEDE